jgi:hypothetical protein
VRNQPEAAADDAAVERTAALDQLRMHMGFDQVCQEPGDRMNDAVHGATLN